MKINKFNINKFIVIVQFDTKDLNYSVKRQCIMRFVRKWKGVCLSPGVFIMDYIDIETPRQEVVDGFVEAGRLDRRDRVICIEAANWTTSPDPFRRRPQQPQFPDEQEEYNTRAQTTVI